MQSFAFVKFRVNLKDAIAIRDDLSRWIDSIVCKRKARKAETDKLKAKRKKAKKGM